MQTNNSHIISDRLCQEAIKIHVVGCGGTGSQLLPRLVQLHKGLVALGHPGGLDVVVWDDDEVSESNTYRQNFFTCDIGHNKAVVMVNRLNVAYGLDWRAMPERFTGDEASNYRSRSHFVIGCVDTKASRREIDRFIRAQTQPTYWIDSGNSADTAQIIVGLYSQRLASDPTRPPLLTELYPDVLAGADDNTPSCSARESLTSQGIATNTMAATWIFSWLATALRHGKIDWTGVFLNLASGRASSIPATPKAWDAINPNRIPLPEAA